MAWKEKPIVSIGNVWCGCCGKKEFEILHGSAHLKCTNCESVIYFSVTWGQMETNGWYVADALSFYRGDSKHPHTRQDEDNPDGIKWRRTDGSLYDIAVIRFNCNNGKKLGDPRVLKAMKNTIRGLERELDQARSGARTEERICKELSSPTVEGNEVESDIELADV